MRISDWSSDVCSSDLDIAEGLFAQRRERTPAFTADLMLVRGHGVGAKSTEHDVGKRISRPPGEPFIAIVCRHRGDTRRAGMQGANADLVSSGLKICTALLSIT